jgi:hypothetical protein
MDLAVHFPFLEGHQDLRIHFSFLFSIVFARILVQR